MVERIYPEKRRKCAIETPRWWRFAAYGSLAVAVTVTGFFLLSAWAINADIAGKRDLDLATAAAFGKGIAAYASIVLAVLTLIAALIGSFARFASAPMWMAMLIALVPSCWLLLP